MLKKEKDIFEYYEKSCDEVNRLNGARASSIEFLTTIKYMSKLCPKQSKILDACADKVKEKGHMLFSDSARIAKKSGAKQLWLTHYSPALTEPKQYLDDACKIFNQTVAAYDGIRTTLGKIEVG